MPKITPVFGPRRMARHPYLRVDIGEYSAAPDLGALVGLTQIGVHLEILHPGARSSLRHWREDEDEFVYLVAGALTLIEDGETELRVGYAAGWAAGAPVGHCFENRSGADATILVVGTRARRDRAHFVDCGVTRTHDRDAGTVAYTDAGGQPIDRETS